MKKETLIEKHFGEKVVNLDYIHSGWDCSAYLLNNKYVVKFPNHEAAKLAIQTESKVLQFLLDLGINIAPNLIYLAPGGQFIIISKLQGEEASKINRNNSELLSVLNDVTDIIFHLADLEEAQVSALEIENDKNIFEKFSHLERSFGILSKYLNEVLLARIGEILDSSQKLKRSTRRFLCHNDICLDHIFVEGSTLVGIIDWADAKFSDPAYEFGRLLRGLQDKKIILEVLKDRNIDDEFISRAEIYAVLSSAEDIVDGHRDKNYKYSKHFANKVRKLLKLTSRS